MKGERVRAREITSNDPTPVSSQRARLSDLYVCFNSPSSCYYRAFVVTSLVALFKKKENILANFFKFLPSIFLIRFSRSNWKDNFFLFFYRKSTWLIYFQDRLFYVHRTRCSRNLDVLVNLVKGGMLLEFMWATGNQFFIPLNFLIFFDLSLSLPECGW